MRVMAAAKSSGLTVSLDPGVCTSEQASGRVLGLLTLVDFFLPSQDELVVLIEGGDADHKISALLDLGCRAVVLKQGKAGGRYVERGFSVNIPARSKPEKRIVDTTGAGDSFNAGFLYGIFNEQSPENALKSANSAAYRMITSQHGIMELIKEVGSLGVDLNHR
jgi:sugar/nucleoside kinase (ribokinase family)